MGNAEGVRKRHWTTDMNFVATLLDEIDGMMAEPELLAVDHFCALSWYRDRLMERKALLEETA